MNAFGPLCGIVWPTGDTINQLPQRTRHAGGREIGYLENQAIPFTPT